MAVLRLHQISLFQFKNYSNKTFRVSDRITGICGKNGVGKTNLLDAIYYLCFTRSYFTRLDISNVQHGKTGFRIVGEMELKDKRETVTCIFRETGKKEFAVNNNPYERFSEHIGRYPCVIIAPDDAILVTGGSEERRKFLDAMLSQVDPVYLRNLIIYHKVLQQRNSLLRSAGEQGLLKDPSLLDVLDGQLTEPGEYIFNRRKDFLVAFLPAVRHLYNEIARKPEDLTIFYESGLVHSPFIELLKAARQKDLLLQRSTVGIHRDELDILLSAQPFRNIASQGQRKSLLFALRLAEMEVLQKEKGFAPLLLLDDVFEKLDEDRMKNLLEKVCCENEGQVFITDTNETRLRTHLQQFNKEYQIISL